MLHTQVDNPTRSLILNCQNPGRTQQKQWVQTDATPQWLSWARASMRPPVLLLWSSVARPKSPILTSPLDPLMNTLSAFRSPAWRTYRYQTMGTRVSAAGPCCKDGPPWMSVRTGSIAAWYLCAPVAVVREYGCCGFLCYSRCMIGGSWPCRYTNPCSSCHAQRLSTCSENTLQRLRYLRQGHLKGNNQASHCPFLSCCRADNSFMPKHLSKPLTIFIV